MKTIFVFSFIFACNFCVKGQLAGIPFDKIDIITTRITPHFYTLTGSPNIDPGHPDGAGGRVGVFEGPDGVFMVDGSYAPLTVKILAAVRKVTDKPVRFLVNTHEHPDHTGGNPNYARAGISIIAREETRNALSQPLPPAIAAVIGNAASGTDPARLPSLTVGRTCSLRVYLNGETIDLIPLSPAHTNGDLMVRFEKEDVIMIGDFYRNYGYPFIDPTHGGSFTGVIAALDTLMQIAGPNTRLIPGHGSIITRSELKPYRDMILDVQSKVRQLMAEGKSRQEVLAARLTAPYDDKVPGGITPLPANLGTSADRFVGALYDELKH